MTNIVIKSLEEGHFDLSLFIKGRINEILCKRDRTNYKVTFSSSLYVCFEDFNLSINDTWSIQIKNPKRHFDSSDFKRFEELNSAIMRYKTVPLHTL